MMALRRSSAIARVAAIKASARRAPPRVREPTSSSGTHVRGDRIADELRKRELCRVVADDPCAELGAVG